MSVKILWNIFVSQIQIFFFFFGKRSIQKIIVMPHHIFKLQYSAGGVIVKLLIRRPRRELPDGKIFKTRNSQASHDIGLWIAWQFLNSVCIHPIELHKESEKDSMSKIRLSFIFPEIWLIPKTNCRNRCSSYSK